MTIKANKRVQTWTIYTALDRQLLTILFCIRLLKHVSTLLFPLKSSAAYYFILYDIVHVSTLYIPFKSPLLTILFCIRLLKHVSIPLFSFKSSAAYYFHPVRELKHVSTFLFALIVTAYHFDLYTWLMFQLSYSLSIGNAYYFILYILKHVSTFLYSLKSSVAWRFYSVYDCWNMFQQSHYPF